MSTPPTPPGRKQRVDAERNRARIVEVARALFAERGDEVQMADVARTAGVGVGTVYRHFPTRKDLIEAAAEQRFSEIVDYARTQCLHHRDPAEGLALFLDRIGEVLSNDRALSATIETALGSTAPQGEMRTRITGIADTLIDQGRAAGTIRQDGTTADVHMIIRSLSALTRDDSGDWRRFLQIALDGLRPR